jgi:hypothetical protein
MLSKIKKKYLLRKEKVTDVPKRIFDYEMCYTESGTYTLLNPFKYRFSDLLSNFRFNMISDDESIAGLPIMNEMSTTDGKHFVLKINIDLNYTLSKIYPKKLIALDSLMFAQLYLHSNYNFTPSTDLLIIMNLEDAELKRIDYFGNRLFSLYPEDAELMHYKKQYIVRISETHYIGLCHDGVKIMTISDWVEYTKKIFLEWSDTVTIIKDKDGKDSSEFFDLEYSLKRSIQKNDSDLNTWCVACTKYKQKKTCFTKL